MELILKSGMWKYWRSNSSSSQPIWRRGKSCPILVMTKAGWENPGGANPADTARGNKAHVDRSVRWQITERCLGSLRAPAQDKELKARQTEGEEESVFDEGRQCLMRASVLSSLPFHTLQGNPRAGTCSSSVRKQSKCKVLRLHQGCTASEFGLAVHKAGEQWGFHTESSPCSLRFLINTEPRAGRQNWWQQHADVSYFISWGDSNLSIRPEDFTPGKPFQSQPCFKKHISFHCNLENCHKTWMWKRLQQQALKI